MDDDGASATTSSCLAIGEKRPRRTGGCVGIFFQLFDWNRRFSKKKLFSKRLLPPDCAKEASKKFRGDEKLRLIADENSVSSQNKNNNGVSGGKNGVQTPTLVARLMGLESMPSVQRVKLLKHSSGEFRVGRQQKLAGEHSELDTKLEPTRQDFRPQKLQKTGISDRRSITRLGAEALQLENVLSKSKKHHHPKLASPVQKTNHRSKRNTSRLIGAATRVLESGLQARNKSKRAITYTARNQLSQKASCKNCGNLIDVSLSKSKQDIDQYVLHSSFDKEHELQPENLASRVYQEGNNRRVDDVRVSFQSKDFVALNRNLTGQTQSKVRGKVENGPSQWQKRQITHNGPHNRPRMVRNVGKQIGSDACKPDYQGQTGNKNGDGMAFRFNSQMKNRCEIPTRLEKRKNNQNATSRKPSAQKTGLQNPSPLTGDFLSALVEEKLQELTSRVGYDSRINMNQPKRTPAVIFQDLISALSTERQISGNRIEFGPKRNHLPHRRHDPNTRFCLQTKLQKAVGLTAVKNNDHLSPGSVIEASFSNDSCCSSTLEDNSGQTQHTSSISFSYDESQFQASDMNPFYSDVVFRKENSRNDLVVDLLTYISQVISTIDIVGSRIKGNMRAHIKHVVFISELVLSNQMPHNPNELNSFFICDILLELDALADIICTKFGNFLDSQNSVAGYQLKRFVFDALIEYLESKYVQYSKCGFRSWINLPSFRGCDDLIHEVVEELKRWMGFVGVTLDELVDRDMNHCLGKWTDFEVEVYETSATIESEILQMLVDEIVVDV